MWGSNTIKSSPGAHKFSCLEGVLVFTSQKEARHWQRHLVGKERGQMGARGSLNKEDRKRGGAHCISHCMDQYVELHGAGSCAQACRSFPLKIGSYVSNVR